METKKSKYDTNPLDPDIARKTEEVWGTDESKPETREMKGATRPVGPAGKEEPHNAQSEAPTRRYDNVPLDTPYPSVFVPPVYSPPSTYQPPSAPHRPPQPDHKPTSRSVAGVGLPEKWAMVLPYAPFYIGVVVALIELFLVPRKEIKVRFHAAQGLALHVVILLVHTLFGVVGTITGSSIGGTLFKLAATIFLIISMVRVWKGETHRIAPLAEPTQWFNERIEPRNKN
ncbi:MAG TPA: hypothetical protein VMM84_17005 [Pyrinomonadaceae bacterium]|nr:hypothetical protein [Pyrinomonadaceae bacterium]